jgi:hypothetical protein
MKAVGRFPDHRDRIQMVMDSIVNTWSFMKGKIKSPYIHQIGETQVEGDYQKLR